MIRAVIGDSFVAELIISTAATRGGVNPAEFYIYSQNYQRRKELVENYNVNTFEDLKELARAKVVVLAIPAAAEAAKTLARIKLFVAPDAVVTSLIHGLKLETLENYFPNRAVVRVALTSFVINGDGVCTYVTGSVNSQEIDTILNAILEKIGKVFRADNEQEFELIQEMFLATTLTVYNSINGIIEGEIKAGLPLETARKITSQIFKGAAEVIAEPNALLEHLMDRANEEKENLGIDGIAQKVIDKYGFWNFAKRTAKEFPVDKKPARFYHQW